jgi:hypothetical protein
MPVRGNVADMKVCFDPRAAVSGPPFSWCMLSLARKEDIAVLLVTFEHARSVRRVWRLGSRQTDGGFIYPDLCRTDDITAESTDFRENTDTLPLLVFARVFLKEEG